ncbi:hypothetical protein SEVIR_5G159450v4 [Setaria viridis]|uniref:Secreted protein n=1 Tax=Setaria viridis TaxID=4556 RepID=A0A4U6UG56_SETVI|nr:hypothetical protein SEVIR_5G159450v2 [Setaria viridis]
MSTQRTLSSLPFQLPFSFFLFLLPSVAPCPWGCEDGEINSCAAQLPVVSSALPGPRELPSASISRGRPRVQLLRE